MRYVLPRHNSNNNDGDDVVYREVYHNVHCNVLSPPYFPSRVGRQHIANTPELYTIPKFVWQVHHMICSCALHLTQVNNCSCLI